MLEYMRTVLNGLKAWVIGEVNKLLSKIDNDIAALRKTLDEASSDFVINATITSDSELATLDKTFAQIQEAINAGKNPIVLMNNKAYLQISDVYTNYISFSSASYDKSGAYFCTLYVYPDQEPQLNYGYSVGLNPDKTMPQLVMDADPTEAMQIATKKYVDEHAGGVTTLHINVTALNPETMEATFTADKTPAEMLQAAVNGPIWCVVTFAAGVISEESISFGAPPAWDTINTVAFGGVTLTIHDKNGKNYVAFVALGMPSNDEWIIDLATFLGS